MNNEARDRKTSVNAESSKYHAVRFYDNERSLARIVAEFLSDGLTAGRPAVVVATPAQRAAILRELIAKGLDVLCLQRSNELMLLDAEDTLATFMKNGEPDGEQFTSRMGDVIKRAQRGIADRTLHIYGQMVDVLWRRGQQDAAIRLEVLWNQLANEQPFSLLCGYAMGHFYKDANLESVCRQHTHVVPADGRTEAVA